MLDAVLESEDAPASDHKSARRQRIEVITRGEPRRRWTIEQKRDIALESLEPGTSPTTVARKHGISSGQLYTGGNNCCGTPSGPQATGSRVSCASTSCQRPRAWRWPHLQRRR